MAYRHKLKDDVGKTIVFRARYTGETRIGGGKKGITLRYCFEKPAKKGMPPFSDHIWIARKPGFPLVSKGDIVEITGYVDYYEKPKFGKIGIGIRDVEEIKIIKKHLAAPSEVA